MMSFRTIFFVSGLTGWCCPVIALGPLQQGGASSSDREAADVEPTVSRWIEELQDNFSNLAQLVQDCHARNPPTRRPPLASGGGPAPGNGAIPMWKCAPEVDTAPMEVETATAHPVVPQQGPMRAPPVGALLECASALRDALESTHSSQQSASANEILRVIAAQVDALRVYLRSDGVELFEGPALHEAPIVPSEALHHDALAAPVSSQEEGPMPHSEEISSAHAAQIDKLTKDVMAIAAQLDRLLRPEHVVEAFENLALHEVFEDLAPASSDVSQIVSAPQLGNVVEAFENLALDEVRPAKSDVSLVPRRTRRTRHHVVSASQDPQRDPDILDFSVDYQFWTEVILVLILLLVTIYAGIFVWYVGARRVAGGTLPAISLLSGTNRLRRLRQAGISLLSDWRVLLRLSGAVVPPLIASLNAAIDANVPQIAYSHQRTPIVLHDSSMIAALLAFIASHN